jgi:hypothetical protein
MEVRPTAPFWAWDLIAEVERGERNPGLVQEIDWRTRRNAKYDRWIARVERGDFSGTTPEMAARAVESWGNRKETLNRWSSGVAYPSWWDRMTGQRAGRIVITAGTERLDQEMVLLHELAHLLAPVGSQHDLAWRRIAARLYKRYGGPEIVAWAIAHERKPLLVAMLQRRAA